MIDKPKWKTITGNGYEITDILFVNGGTRASAFMRTTHYDHDGLALCTSMVEIQDIDRAYRIIELMEEEEDEEW